MRKERGFTLVEVVVASVLFAVFMLFGTSLFVHGKESAARARIMSHALQLMENEMHAAKMKRLWRGYIVDYEVGGVSSFQVPGGLEVGTCLYESPLNDEFRNIFYTAYVIMVYKGKKTLLTLKTYITPPLRERYYRN